jgi:hypothetical protein
VTPPPSVVRRPVRLHARSHPAAREAPVVAAAAVAFVGTLMVPAIAILWWSLAAVLAVAALMLAGTWLRRLSPEGAASPGR